MKWKACFGDSRRTAFLEFPHGFNGMCLCVLCNGVVSCDDCIASVRDTRVWSNGGMILTGESMEHWWNDTDRGEYGALVE